MGVGFVAGNDYVGAARERSAGEGFEGAATHDDGVAEGEGFEVFKVGGDVVEEVAGAADGSVASDGGDYLNGGFHRIAYTATSPLMWGWGL